MFILAGSTQGTPGYTHSLRSDIGWFIVSLFTAISVLLHLLGYLLQTMRVGSEEAIVFFTSLVGVFVFGRAVLNRLSAYLQLDVELRKQLTYSLT